MMKDENHFLSSFKVCYISNKGKKYFTRDFLRYTNNNEDIAYYIFKNIKGQEIIDYIKDLCKVGKLHFTNSGNYVLNS